jgi:thioredoxin:protein disulfide reductase
MQLHARADLPLLRAAFLFLLVLFTVTRAGAQFGAAPQKPLVSLSGAVNAAGERIEGEVVATIDATWHINSNKPLDEFLIPTVLTLEPETLQDVRIAYPPHKEMEFSFSTGKVAVYDGTIRIPFSAIGSPEGVRATLRYQACNDNVCLPPTKVSAVLTSGAAVGSSGGSAETFTPLTAAPAAGASLFGADLGTVLATRGLLLTLVVVFVLGLALNLTPCVYPLIPITLAFFSSQSEGKRGYRAGLSVAYVGGLALTYSALGVFSAMTGGIFGAWLQRPSVLIFFALLMLALAASMFGAYDIRVPHFITDRAGARGGFAGALMMGLLVGIVAAPCVGPAVVALIALVGQSGSIGLGFALFFTLALGLGFPYLVGVNALPRSGVWMEHVKKAMGFILIAVAFYFVRPLVGDELYGWGVGLSLLAGALFLFFVGRKSPSGRAIRITSAVILLTAGIFFLWPRQHVPGIEWERYAEGQIAAAQTAGKPVMIDFYADWCLPCKELDEKTFNDGAVMAEAERFVRLKADLTLATDERTAELTERYNIVGVPTIVFIDASGREVSGLRLTGFESASRFLERMRGVR